MAFLDPEFLIAAMRATAWMDPQSDFAFDENSAGPEGEEVLDSVQAALRSWDSKFVLRSGYYTYYDQDTRSSSWPIPRHLTTPELAEFGKAHDILREVPRAGDIFLQWNPAVKAFIHCGVIGRVYNGFRIGQSITSINLSTIEGDTNETLSLRGGKVKRGRRTMSPASGDRFLRWAVLDTDDVRAEHEARPGSIVDQVMERMVDITPLPNTADGVDAFLPAWSVFEPAVLEHVHSLTRDPLDRDDLIQEARWKLHKLDPTRMDLSVLEQVQYVQASLRNHVYDLWNRGPA